MQTNTRFSCEFNREITLKWGPCHCKIDGTLAADKLFSTKEKPENPVLQSTCKQMIKSNMQIIGCVVGLKTIQAENSIQICQNQTKKIPFYIKETNLDEQN